MRRQLLLIFNLFVPENEGNVNLRADEARHRHASLTSVEPTFVSRPNVGIAQQVVTITYVQRTIAARMYVKRHAYE